MNNFISAIITLLLIIGNTLNAQERVIPKLMMPVGHSGTIISAEFSPDGTKVVSASFDRAAGVNYLFIWDLISEKIINIVEDYNVFDTGEGSHSTLSIYFSRSGNRIICTDGYDSFTILDAASGERIFHEKGYDRIVLSIDRDKIITCSVNDYTQPNLILKLWDIETASPKNEDNFILQKKDWKIYEGFEFDCYNQYLFFISNNMFTVWDIDLKKIVSEKLGKKAIITGHKFTTDGKSLILSTEDAIYLWDLEKHKLLKKISPGFVSELYTLVSEDNKRLFLYEKNFDENNLEEKFQIFMYDIENGDLVSKTPFIGIEEFILNYSENSDYFDLFPELISRLDPGHSNNDSFEYVYELSNIAKNDIVGKIVIKGDSIAELWDGDSTHSFYGGPQIKFNTLNYSLDGRFVLLFNTNYFHSKDPILVLNAENLELITTLGGKVNYGSRGMLSFSGKMLFIQTVDNILLWNVEKGEVSCTIPISDHRLLSDVSDHLLFSHDGSKFVNLTKSGIEIREVNTGKLVVKIQNNEIKGSLLPYSTYHRNFIFSNDDSLIAFITDEGVEIRNLKTGELSNHINSKDTRVLSNGFNYLREFSFTSNDQRFFLQTELGLEVRDVNTGKLLTYIEKTSDYQYGIASLSSRGQMIALPTTETIDIIDVQTGQLIKQLILPNSFDENITVNIDFCPNDSILMTQLITDDRGRFACLWDLNGERLIKTIEYSDACSFTEDSKRVISSHYDEFIIWDAISGEQIDSLYYTENTLDTSLTKINEKWINANSWLFNRLSEVTVYPPHAGHILSSDKLHTTLLTTENNVFNLYDIGSGQKLYSIITLDSSDYLTIHPDGYYDGTELARNLIYFVCNGEIINLSQMKEALYVPGLVEKIMTGQEINDRKLSDLGICDALPIVTKLDGKKYRYTIRPRRLPLERAEVYVNDKLVFSYPVDQLSSTGDIYELEIDENELDKQLQIGEENRVKVIGVVKSEYGSELRTRGITEPIEKKSKGEVVPPRLFAVMIGVNDYKDPNLRLSYPVKDAKELGKAIETAATKLLGEDNVFMYPIHTEVKPGTGFTTPEKAGIKRALEDIGTKARPEDILLMFFAGHGEMQGVDGKQFTFLTADASSSEHIGISTKELQNWLSYQGPHKMLANKTILIFDACYSGQVNNDFVVQTRNDDPSKRIKQVEDLKDKSGMFILAGSAPDQAAYELAQYQHGMLTYSLLSVLKKNPGILDDQQFLNVQKWFLESEQKLKEEVRSKGLKQDAKPFGTANIRIGIVDEEVRESIKLANERPTVHCANVLEFNANDDILLLKDLISKELIAISTRGNDKFVILAPTATGQINKLNISYMLKDDVINSNIKLLKGNETLLHKDIVGKKSELTKLVKEICEEVVKHAK